MMPVIETGITGIMDPVLEFDLLRNVIRMLPEIRR